MCQKGIFHVLGIISYQFMKILNSCDMIGNSRRDTLRRKRVCYNTNPSQVLIYTSCQELSIEMSKFVDEIYFTLKKKSCIVMASFSEILFRGVRRNIPIFLVQQWKTDREISSIMRFHKF